MALILSHHASINFIMIIHDISSTVPSTKNSIGQSLKRIKNSIDVFILFKMASQVIKMWGGEGEGKGRGGEEWRIEGRGERGGETKVNIEKNWASSSSSDIPVFSRIVFVFFICFFCFCLFFCRHAQEARTFFRSLSTGDDFQKLKVIYSEATENVTFDLIQNNLRTFPYLAFGLQSHTYPVVRYRENLFNLNTNESSPFVPTTILSLDDDNDDHA